MIVLKEQVVDKSQVIHRACKDMIEKLENRMQYVFDNIRMWANFAGKDTYIQLLKFDLDWVKGIHSDLVRSMRLMTLTQDEMIRANAMWSKYDPDKYQK